MAVTLLVGKSDAQGLAAAPVGLHRDVHFEQYSTLSTNQVLVTRLLSPLAAERVRRSLSNRDQILLDQPIDLRDEHFSLYVPSTPPLGGYGLMVFVPPWREAKIPESWLAVLGRSGMIMVTAARSGNDENIIGRRAPLALLAAQNVLLRYPVNPDRVYVAGFSGGSRIALRLAIAFPDLFRGAFLNAGSDPVGDEGIPAPRKTLLYKFQENSTVIAATGSEDAANISKDNESQSSLANWCVFNVTAQISPWANHDIAGPEVLSSALDLLKAPRKRDAPHLNTCRLRLEAQLTADVQRVQADITSARTHDANKRIVALDKRFGGLAEDSVVKLADDCACGLFK